MIAVVLLRRILLALLGCSLGLVASAQTLVYVSPLGNDATGDGSIGNPFLTIAKGAQAANNLVVTTPTVPVDVLVRAGTYRNSGFSTPSMLDANSYDPQNAGDAHWKGNAAAGWVVRLNNIHGNANAWITIKPYPNEVVTLEGDGDIAFSIRSSSYVKVQGFKIRGVADRIPLLLAWRYWGTYRYLQSGNFVYGDRKEDICATYGLSVCNDIPPMVLTTGTTYSNLPNINALNVSRPALFDGKGLLVQLSHHIEVRGCEIYDFPGGGLRVTAADYVDVLENDIHHNSSRASVGTHGLVIEGLTEESGDNSTVRKMLVARNKVHDNFNELYSWVQSKTICTALIDEGKGIALLRTSPTMSNFNGSIRVENNICYNNGKSGIHSNDVDNAEIVNNTVYSNGYTNRFNPSLSGGTNAGISIQSSNNIKIIGNIAVVDDGLNPALIALSEGQNCSGWQVSHNIVRGGGPSNFVGGFTVTDPQFVNMVGNDVHLLATSPAIDNALAMEAPLDDYDRQLRDATPDIGALEYAVTVGVNWLEFEAASAPDGSVALNWSTASETGNAYFTVERSADGWRWEGLQRVQAAGDSPSPVDYAAQDRHPLPGLNHYRIRQSDFDGRSSFSETRTVVVAHDAMGVGLFPNPGHDQLIVWVGEKEPIEVFALDGRAFADRVRMLSRNANQVTVDVSQLPAGLYLLRVGGRAMQFVKE